MKYFVTSIIYEVFALTDLKPDQDVMDICGGIGSFSMFSFAPDSISNSLIDKYPDNYKLRKSLGYYYHEVHLRYQKNWLESDSIVIKRFFDNYKVAYDNGLYDYWSAYGLRSRYPIDSRIYNLFYI